MSLPAILINYNFSPDWIKDYPELGPITIFDRSDDNVDRNLQQYGEIYRTKNIGDVDYDKLSYLIENYDNLPDVFLWSKTNIFKFVDELTLREAIKGNKFKPLIRPDHRTYSDHLSPVCFYRGEWYYERADSWFFGSTDSRYFHNWEDWCTHFMLPKEAYIPFAPGGSYILTKDIVHKYGKAFYEEMRDMLPHTVRPAEAQCAERSYGFLWGR